MVQCCTELDVFFFFFLMCYFIPYILVILVYSILHSSMFLWTPISERILALVLQLYK